MPGPFPLEGILSAATTRVKIRALRAMVVDTGGRIHTIRSMSLSRADDGIILEGTDFSWLQE